jgi:hypothetical protein
MKDGQRGISRAALRERLREQLREVGRKSVLAPLSNLQGAIITSLDLKGVLLADKLKPLIAKLSL